MTINDKEHAMSEQNPDVAPEPTHPLSPLKGFKVSDLPEGLQPIARQMEELANNAVETLRQEAGLAKKELEALPEQATDGVYALRAGFEAFQEAWREAQARKGGNSR
jgi:hypothetical protein